MVKSNSCIYLISNFPVFNLEEIREFNIFNKKDSSALFSALIYNHRQNFISSRNNNHIVYCFDGSDRNRIPADLEEESSVQFCEEGHNKSSIRLLAERFFGNYINNLVVFGPSIGFTPGEIDRAMNLLSMNDEAVVLGKSFNEEVVFIGFNSYNQELFDSIDGSGGNFDRILADVNRHENFIHIMGNYQFIKDLEDFKRLYAELSKKESWAYCNQQMHEQFTQLFIEYKGLLK